MSASVKALYEGLIRAASSFKDKNFRQYFQRIVEDDFAQFNMNKSLTETEFLKRQSENLQILERQSMIHNMYYSEGFAVKR